MNKAYKTYFLSLFKVVLASVMLVSCSVDDDTQGNKTIVSDYTANNVTMKNGYWVVDGSDAGSCAVTISSGTYTSSNDVLEALNLTFSNVPWLDICNKLFADETLQGATLMNESDASKTGSLTLALSVLGHTITSNLMIAKINDNGVEKALKSPLKLVCVAQL